MWSETVTKTVMENCLQVVVMRSPRSRTVSLGLFIDHGAKDEDVSSNGISHFIEHLVFNPAHMDRTTRERLDQLMDRGAAYEAYTGKEFTRATLTCRADALPAAVACMAGILTRPRVAPEAVEHERSIILHERDTYFASGRAKEELVEQALWGNRSMGLYVIGRRDNILNFQAQSMQERLERFYTPQNTRLVILGDVAPNDVVRLVEEHFSDWNRDPLPRRPIVIEEEPNIIGLPSQGSRADVTFAFLGVPFDSSDRYAINVLGDLLGGGIKSRLFQEVREKRHLCYAIHAYTISYRLGGYLGINVNTGSEQVEEVYQAVTEVLEDVRQNPVSEEELERVKAARMTGLLELPNDARRHLQMLGRHNMLGRDFFVDWECNEIRRVTAKDIQRVAQFLFAPERLAIAGLGVGGEQLAGLL